jgi:hypothetical protein
MARELKRIATVSTAPATDVAFSPDGGILAAVGPRSVSLVEGAQVVAEIAAPADRLLGARFGASSDELLAAPLVLRLGDRSWAPLPPLQTGLEAGLDANPRGGFAAHAADWTPDGRHLLVYAVWSAQKRIGAPGSYGGPTERLLVLDGATRAPAAVLEETQGVDAYAAVAAGESCVAAAGRGGAVWSRAGDLVGRLPRGATVTRVLRFSADGSLLGLGRADGSAALYSTGDWTCVADWKAHDDEARALAFGTAQELVATGGGDGRIRLWSREGDAVGEADAPAPVGAVDLDARGGRVAAACDGTVVLYELAGG